MPDTAPDFSLPASDNTTFTLSAALEQHQHVLLVFHRHLGCLPCRDHIQALQQQRAAFDQRDVQIVVLSFVSGLWAERWLEDMQHAFLMVFDTKREVYANYGLTHGFWRVWQPKTIWYYAKQLLRGRLPNQTQGDAVQLGGDFLVTQGRQVLLAHPSQNPTDRPNIAALLSALDNA